ncbi:MAG: ComF family protein [Bacillota bacterium]|jgi:competence protein ComFC
MLPNQKEAPIAVIKKDKVLALFSSILRRLTDLVYGRPSCCALCGSLLPRTGGKWSSRSRERELRAASQTPGICDSCLDRLALQMAWVCEICGGPIKPPLRVCPDCQKCFYTFDGQRSAGIYDSDLKNAVIRMKFQGERWLSRPLGWLVAKAARDFLPVDLVIPIPIDPGSRIRRGYNQAMDLAKEVSALLDVPLVDVLSRDKRYSHQAELGRNKRWGNLKESMGAKRTVNLKGKRCLLIDDVTTTGATLDEAARVLKHLGAEKVFCATVARTLRH